MTRHGGRRVTTPPMGLNCFVRAVRTLDGPFHPKRNEIGAACRPHRTDQVSR